MIYDFLKNRYISVTHITRDKRKDDGSDDFDTEHYANGFVISVEELTDREKITFVDENGEVLWFIMDKIRPKFLVKVLDWDINNPYKPKKEKTKDENTKDKSSRFEMMDLNDSKEE